MSFLDQKPRVATAADLQRRWSFGKPGENFRCYLCGHKFEVGDTWRFVYANGYAGEKPPPHNGNFLVCTACDGPDVLARWYAMNREARTKFWWLRRSL